MNAAINFAIDTAADPLTFSFQAVRLALVHQLARRTAGLHVDCPLPTLLRITGADQPMAELLATLERAQVFAPLELDVIAADEQGVEDFAEYLRDRTDQVVIIARKAPKDPAI